MPDELGTIHPPARPSLPTTPLHGGEPGSDGTLTSEPPGETPINGHGTSSSACSFDEDHVPTTHAVFVVSLPTIPKQGGSKSGRTLSCHRSPVLETAHLASSLVRPVGYVEADAPPSPSSVPWRFGLCQLGLGLSLSISDPDQKDLRPEGFTPSLPHPWSAATTAEEGPTTQTTGSSPKSKAPAPCSQFWRGVVVYATYLLGCTNYGSVYSTWSRGT